MKITTLRALQSKNIGYTFRGSCSVIGTWMQRTAMYWLIYEKTGSHFMLGVAVFAAQFPSFLLSALGGVVSDRFNRYRVLLLTQVASFLQAAILTAVVISGNDTVWLLLSLSVVLGIINAFDVPARQSMIYEMVDNKDDVPNAIALNSSMFHLARLIGPAMSESYSKTRGVHLFFDQCSKLHRRHYNLLFLRLPPYKRPERITNALTDLRNGFIYLKQTPAISQVMLMLALISLFSCRI